MRHLAPILLLILLSACTDRPLPKRPVAEVIREHAPALMEIDHVQGVYEGADDQGAPCIVIMVDELTPETRAALPEQLEGYPVRIQATGDIVPQE